MLVVLVCSMLLAFLSYFVVKLKYTPDPCSYLLPALLGSSAPRVPESLEAGGIGLRESRARRSPHCSQKIKPCNAYHDRLQSQFKITIEDNHLFKIKCSFKAIKNVPEYYLYASNCKRENKLVENIPEPELQLVHHSIPVENKNKS
jgi:hypothetical protein